MPLTQSDNNRVGGWLALKEWLRVQPMPEGGEGARLQIFSTCTDLLRCLPSLLSDPKRIGDCRTEPHEITHLPDALRYFAVMQADPPRAAAAAPRLRDFTGGGRRKNRF